VDYHLCGGLPAELTSTSGRSQPDQHELFFSDGGDHFGIRFFPRSGGPCCSFRGA
jgi:hypothetical protein